MTSRSIAVSLAVLLPVAASSIPCQAQRNSGAASITLTAVLAQSLTMSATPAELQSGSASNLLDRSPERNFALTISTTWIRGTGNISVGVFAPGNPLLGVAGQALVPVEASSNSGTSCTPAGNRFLSSAQEQEKITSPEIRIDTSDLQIPAG